MILLKERVRAFKIRSTEVRMDPAPTSTARGTLELEKKGRPSPLLPKERLDHSRESAGRSSKCQPTAFPSPPMETPHERDPSGHHAETQTQANRRQMPRLCPQQQGRAGDAGAASWDNNRQHFINLAQKILGDFKKC